MVEPATQLHYDAGNHRHTDEYTAPDLERTKHIRYIALETDAISHVMPLMDLIGITITKEHLH